MKNLIIVLAVAVLAVLVSCKKEPADPVLTFADVKHIEARSITIMETGLDTSDVFFFVYYLGRVNPFPDTIHRAWYKNQMPVTIDLQRRDIGSFRDTTFVSVTAYQCPGTVVLCPASANSFSAPFHKNIFPETRYCETEWALKYCIDLKYHF